jgi:pilus assembly protein Flp/PilA
MTMLIQQKYRLRCIWSMRPIRPMPLFLYTLKMLKIYFRLRQMMCSNSPRGQGLLEYAILIVLVGVVIMAALILIGPAIGNMYSNIVETTP